MPYHWSADEKMGNVATFVMTRMAIIWLMLTPLSSHDPKLPSVGMKLPSGKRRSIYMSAYNYGSRRTGQWLSSQPQQDYLLHIHRFGQRSVGSQMVGRKQLDAPVSICNEYTYVLISVSVCNQ